MSKLSGLGRALSLLSVAFGGMGRDYPKYILESQGERLVLPVTPDNYNLTNGQDNKVINITQVGEALLFGNPKLRTLSFSGFFPARDYPFTVGDRKSPDACVALLTKWMEAKAPIRVIITDSPINLMMGLMSFPYKKKDPTGDIYFDASFTEYKDLNTQAAGNDKPLDESTGLKNRPDAAIKPKTATLFSRGADVLDAAKKAYGDYNHYERIIQSNDLKNLAINNLSQLRKLKV